MEEKDVKIKFEHRMNTLKETGSTVIGADQSARVSAESEADKAWTDKHGICTTKSVMFSSSKYKF
jgi:hypothetical protein